MIKIAGITWWKNNYGSILQAYALNKTLNSFPNVRYEILRQYAVNAVSFSTLFARIKKRGVRNTISYFFGKFCRPELRRRNQKCEEFVKNHLLLSDYYDIEKDTNKSDLAEVYDAFLCGSDQIWNPSMTERNSIYWLNIAGAKKKIAYAPSIGITSSDEMLKEEIRDALEGFCAISCRENAGTEFLNTIIGENVCKTVLDPTLLLSIDDWNSVAINPEINSPYVFAYILRGDEQQRAMIKSFAENNNMLLVTIPFLEAETKSKLDIHFGNIQKTDADPGEFIGLIKNAQYVFTDSFHCMIFSSIYHKTFFSLKKFGNNQMLRINDFQAWMGLNNRVIEKQADIEMLKRIDSDKLWAKFEERLCIERKRSMEFLSNAIFDE